MPPGDLSQPLPDSQAAQAPWPLGVHALVSTRHGGVSRAPYDSANLGDHVGDDPAAVAENRQRLAQRLRAHPVFLSQVHGTAVQALSRATPDGLVADAAWTDTPGVACTAMVADCLPVLFAAADGQSVAAAHAGWRGLLGQGGRGVLEALCHAWPAAGSRAQRAGMTVWLGPCIGPRAFEVGPEVQQAYVALDPALASAFVPVPQRAGHFLADLAALARQRLHGLGFARLHGNDGTPPWCTVEQASLFFSHRRAGRLGLGTGRMAAVVWRA